MSVAKTAKDVYENELRNRLESEHHGEFVAIEPESRQYFVSTTFMGAALAAKQACPEKMSFVIRIGHDAAVHIGAAKT